MVENSISAAFFSLLEIKLGRCPFNSHFRKAVIRQYEASVEAIGSPLEAALGIHGTYRNWEQLLSHMVETEPSEFDQTKAEYFFEFFEFVQQILQKNVLWMTEVRDSYTNGGWSPSLVSKWRCELSQSTTDAIFKRCLDSMKIKENPDLHKEDLLDLLETYLSEIGWDEAFQFLEAVFKTYLRENQ